MKKIVDITNLCNKKLKKTTPLNDWLIHNKTQVKFYQQRGLLTPPLASDMGSG